MLVEPQITTNERLVTTGNDWFRTSRVVFKTQVTTRHDELRTRLNRYIILGYTRV